jgi:hypothetical protein
MLATFYFVVVQRNRGAGPRLAFLGLHTTIRISISANDRRVFFSGHRISDGDGLGGSQSMEGCNESH